MTEPLTRLIELRKEQYMTQKRLSVELGVSQETISSYEIGRHRPRQENLIKLAEVFNVDPDYILGKTSHRLAIPEKMLSDSEAAMINIYRSLGKEHLENVHYFFEGMKALTPKRK